MKKLILILITITLFGVNGCKLHRHHHQYKVYNYRLRYDNSPNNPLDDNAWIYLYMFSVNNTFYYSYSPVPIVNVSSLPYIQSAVNPLGQSGLKGIQEDENTEEVALEQLNETIEQEVETQIDQEGLDGQDINEAADNVEDASSSSSSPMGEDTESGGESDSSGDSSSSGDSGGGSE